MLHKDIFQILFNYLPLDDKYSFHKYSVKNFKDNIVFTNKIIEEIENMNKSRWAKICYTLTF